MSDPLELVLEIELQSIQDEVAAVQQRLQALQSEQREAQDAEGEALAQASAMHAYADPLVWQTGREHLAAQAETPGIYQAGLLVGDSPWRINHPDAAQALGQAQAADRAVQLASAHTIRLAQQREDLEYRVLPYLNGALSNKQRELEQHRQAQQAAVAHVSDRSWVEEFRRKIRGDP